jgi:alpha-D-ribose 1-methylphosphonate 5-triphosphate synthase subunit PhnL
MTNRSTAPAGRAPGRSQAGPPPLGGSHDDSGGRGADIHPTLKVEALHKRFTLHLRDGLELPVLDGVELQVHAGECLALVGASGRGKSTLVKCLYGSYGIDGGRALLRRADGETVDLAQASAQAMLALRRAEIAYVSQFLRALPRVPALDLVAERWLQAHAPAVPDPHADPFDEEAEAAATAEARAVAAALLARLNLPPSLWPLPPATFSGGEQQRINLARGFVVPSRLLLLDEPTASLDAANRKVVIELIREARQRGSAVVGIFHDEEVRDAVADRVLAFE